MTVHTNGVVVAKVNAVKPLLAVAVSVVGLTPNVTGVAGAKVTVWLPVFTANVRDTEGAGRKAALPA